MKKFENEPSNSALQRLNTFKKQDSVPNKEQSDKEDIAKPNEISNSKKFLNHSQNMTSLENSSVLNNLKKIYDKNDNLSQIPEFTEVNLFNDANNIRSSNATKIVTSSSKIVTSSSNKTKNRITVSHKSIINKPPILNNMPKSLDDSMQSIIQKVQKVQKNMIELSQEKDQKNIIINGSEYNNDEDLDDIEENPQQISQKSINKSKKKGLIVRKFINFCSSNIKIPKISQSIILESLSEEIEEVKEKKNSFSKKKYKKKKRVYQRKPPSPSETDQIHVFRSKRIRKKPVDVFNSLQAFEEQKMKNKLKAERTVKCNCKNTQCIAQYCVCAKNGTLCGVACGCVNCINYKQNEKLMKVMRTDFDKNNAFSYKNRFEKIFIKNENGVDTEIMINIKGCNCDKSKCKKKYCECFKLKIACTGLCKCIDCHNNKLDIDIPQEIQKKHNNIFNKEFSAVRNEIKNLISSSIPGNEKKNTTIIETKKIAHYDLLKQFDPSMPSKKITVNSRTNQYQKKKKLPSQNIIKEKLIIAKKSKKHVKKNQNNSKNIKTPENESYIHKLNQITMTFSPKKTNNLFPENVKETSNINEYPNNQMNMNLNMDMNMNNDMNMTMNRDMDMNIGNDIDNTNNNDNNNHNNPPIADNTNRTTDKLNINSYMVHNLENLREQINSNNIEILNMTNFNRPHKCFLTDSDAVYYSSEIFSLPVPELKKANSEFLNKSSSTVRKCVIAKRSRSLGLVKPKKS